MEDGRVATRLVARMRSTQFFASVTRLDPYWITISIGPTLLSKSGGEWPGRGELARPLAGTEPGGNWVVVPWAMLDSNQRSPSCQDGALTN